MLAQGVETFTNTITQAEKASDRWLFLAAVGIILLGSGAIIKYLINALAKQQELHAKFIEGVYTENIKQRAENIAALQDNSSALKRNNEFLDDYIKVEKIDRIKDK